MTFFLTAEEKGSIKIAYLFKSVDGDSSASKLNGKANRGWCELGASKGSVENHS